MNLESKKTTVQKSQKELYSYLTDLENFKSILPDSLEEFSVSGDSFKFQLKGMPAIRLAFDTKQEFDLIKLKATSDTFPIYLICKIDAISDTQSETQLFFEGEINAMMAMMLKKPLQNLLDGLVGKMGEFITSQ
ncbi:MAG TPA: SRPBCC family protein [Lutibacter sp.]|nr:SRPBCC family protein [Lutibacter sp.]